MKEHLDSEIFASSDAEGFDGWTAWNEFVVLTGAATHATSVLLKFGMKTMLAAGMEHNMFFFV